VVPVGHVVGVGDGFTTGALDLCHHLLGRRDVGAGTVEGGTDVVDHHTRPLGGEGEGVGPADAAPGTGVNHDPALADAHQQARPPSIDTMEPVMNRASSLAMKANTAAISSGS